MDLALLVPGVAVGVYALNQSALTFLFMFVTLATGTYLMLPSVLAAWVVAAASCALAATFDGESLAAVMVGPQFGAVTYLIAASVRHFGGSPRTAALVAASLMVGLVFVGTRYIKKKSA